MAYVKEYWENKEQRAIKAKKHTELMGKKYRDEIERSTNNTKVYGDNFKYTQNSEFKPGLIKLDAIDSVSGIFKHTKGKTCVLNFASYKNAGGMFLNGSKAQEECLCHESFLYNVLSKFKNTYYKWNIEHKNKALYLNRALYSEDVIFIKEGKSIKCDVLTCAAPNKSASQKYCNTSDKENSEHLEDRIKFVMDIVKENKVDTVVLGAFGCGVFGQDATEVANIFKKHLKGIKGIVFAIPKGRDGNYNKFDKCYERLTT